MRIKKLAWDLALAICRSFPISLKRFLCRLLFASEIKRCEDGLRELLFYDDVLKWYIDQAAINYENGIHPKHRLTDYHSFFIKKIQAGECVLDVGCGNGALSYSIAKAGAVIIGVDINIEQINIAKRLYRHETLKFLQMDITCDHFEGEIDTVVLSNVLEHIEDRIGLLLKLSRNNRPKRYLIRVPMINRHWIVPLKRELGVPYFSDTTHFIEYTVDTFANEMAQAGLSVADLQVNWGEIWSEVISNAKNHRSNAGI